MRNIICAIMGLQANYSDAVGHICTIYQCDIIYAVHTSPLKALYLQGIVVVVFCHAFRKLKILEGQKEVFDSLSLFSSGSKCDHSLLNALQCFARPTLPMSMLLHQSSLFMCLSLLSNCKLPQGRQYITLVCVLSTCPNAGTVDCGRLAIRTLDVNSGELQPVPLFHPLPWCFILQMGLMSIVSRHKQSQDFCK